MPDTKRFLVMFASAPKSAFGHKAGKFVSAIHDVLKTRPVGVVDTFDRRLCGVTVQSQMSASAIVAALRNAMERDVLDDSARHDPTFRGPKDIADRIFVIEMGAEHAASDPDCDAALRRLP